MQWIMKNKQVKITLLLVSSLTIMSMITISASLPDMTNSFSQIPNGKKLVKLTLSFPALFIAISAMVTGIIIDRFGRLKLLGISLILYAIGGSSGYWLDNIYFILAGRALLGVSVGVSMTIVTTLVADYYEGNSRQKFAGLQIAIMSIGGIVFITLGGLLADIHWKIPFLLYLFSLLILPFTYLYLKEPPKQAKIKSIDKTAKSPVPECFKKVVSYDSLTMEFTIFIKTSTLTKTTHYTGYQQKLFDEIKRLKEVEGYGYKRISYILYDKGYRSIRTDSILRHNYVYSI